MNEVVTFVVSEQNIYDGTPMSEKACPIALSAMDAGLEDVEVNGNIITFLDPKNHCTYMVDLPLSAQRFVDTFDRAWPVRAFSFSLEYGRDDMPWGGSNE